MKDILQDVVAKTHALGFLSLVKVNSEADATTIESMAEDRSVILNSTTHNPVAEFNGTFGMPNLDKLALHLKNPEYQKDAKIDVVKAERNGEVIPTHIHFENASGDFENDYRFMNKQIIEEKLQEKSDEKLEVKEEILKEISEYYSGDVVLARDLIEIN